MKYGTAFRSAFRKKHFYTSTSSRHTCKVGPLQLLTYPPVQIFMYHNRVLHWVVPSQIYKAMRSDTAKILSLKSMMMYSTIGASLFEK